MVVAKVMPLVLVGQAVAAVQTKLAVFPEARVIHLQPLLYKVGQVALELLIIIRIVSVVVVEVLEPLVLQVVPLKVVMEVLG
jgi:hypothetical protein